MNEPARFDADKQKTTKITKGGKMDDVEFALRVSKADWQTREFVELLLKLDDSKDLREATDVVSECFSALKELVIQRYTEIVAGLRNEGLTSASDERIRMQGGQ